MGTGGGEHKTTSQEANSNLSSAIYKPGELQPREFSQPQALHYHESGHKILQDDFKSKIFRNYKDQFFLSDSAEHMKRASQRSLRCCKTHAGNKKTIPHAASLQHGVKIWYLDIQVPK